MRTEVFKRSNKNGVDERHVAAAKSVVSFVLDGLWYEAGRELVEDERLKREKYSKTKLTRAFGVIGYHDPPSRRYFRNCIEGYRGLDDLSVRRSTCRGSSVRYAYWLVRWNRRGELSREDLIRLLKYRKKFIRGHPLSMDVFRVRSKEKLENLLTLEAESRKQINYE